MKKKIIVIASLFIMIFGISVNAITYHYDDKNRVIEVIYDDGSKMNYEYDDAGNITKSIFTPAPSKLESIFLEKGEYTLGYDESASIKVMTKNSEDIVEEVTQNAVFKVENKNIAVVKNGGVIVPKSLGETKVHVTYLGEEVIGKIIVKDLKAPTIPNNVKATEVTENSIEIQWDESIDDFGIQLYQVYLDGKYYKQVSDTKLKIEGLNINTEYSIRVRAKDNNSNYSDFSGRIKIKTLDKLTYKLVIEKKNSKKGDSNWDERCDLNNDGVVDEKDIDLAKERFAPTSPNNLEATALSKNSVKLEWSSSSDDIGVKEYKIFDLSGEYITSTNDNYVIIDKLKAGSKYSFYVIAVDEDLLESPKKSIEVNTLKVKLDDVSKCYGSVEGDDNWDPDCDVNNDGKIDITDMVIIGKES